jgi:4-amino-4-deoxy-L-arabinose transferase-like glycosyltransferase
MGREAADRSRGPCLGVPGWAVVGTLLALHAALLLGNLSWNFIVYDEVAHVPAGVSHWQTGSFCLDRVNPPMARMIAAAPVLLAGPRTDYHRLDPRHGIRREWEVGEDFIKANGGRSYDLIRLARLPGVLWSVLGGWLAYRWARELYGEPGGYVALIVWCFEPTILAFAPVVTPDLPSAVAGLAAVYLFRQHLRRSRWSTAVTAGVALGLALLAKHTLVLLFGILPLLWFVHRYPRPLGGGPTKLRRELLQAALIGAIGLYTLNAGYGFQGTGRSLGGYRFVSRLFTGDDGSSNRFQGSWLGRAPVPLPEDYLAGIDLQRRDFEGGFQSYLNGTWRDQGWWYYYLEALALKEPVGLWALGAWGLGMLLVRHPGTAGLREELLLLIPAAVFLGVVSAQTGFSHHMRYVMPMFPFVIVGLGKLGYYFRPGRRLGAFAVSGLLAWAGASSLAAYPHSLSYFNEVAGGPANGHAFLLDSNIDWGQDLLRLRHWLREHPEARPLRLAYFGSADPRLFGLEYRLPPLDPAGLRAELEDCLARGVDAYYAVSVTLLRGKRFPVFDGRGGWEQVETNHSFDFLREIPPVARAGYSIYIYRVTPAQAGSLIRSRDVSPRGG